MLFLTILAIISNSSEDSIDNIQDQMFLMNCPLPIFNGNVTDVNIDGFTVVYNVTYSSSNSTGSLFQCSTNVAGFNVSEITKEYGATAFGFIPIGWLGYIADTLTILFNRLQAMVVMIGFFVTPSNFNILGYTLADIGGIALMFVIGVYAFCYVGIGAMIYKIVSPFSGGS